MTQQTKQPEPYVGPRPFKREEGEFFFGRRIEVNDLASLITAYQVVLLYAQSGAGKTSLLHASLIPRLERDENFHVLTPARVSAQAALTVAPAVIRNVFIFNALSDWNGGRFSQAELAQMSLADFLKRYRRDKNIEGTPMVVIFDQFEELFTQHLDRWEDREDFFQQVADALTADSTLRVYFVMREDYIGELDPYAQILPGKLRTRFRMERLRRDNALEAVTGPLGAESLKGTKLCFAPGVAEALVDDLLKIRVQTGAGEREVPGQFVEPVQLQVVCQALWQELKPKDEDESKPEGEGGPKPDAEDVVITFDHLKAFGDVNQALTRFYEQSIKKASAESGVSEGALHRWCDRVLITPDGNRRAVLREEGKTEGLPNAAIDVLVRERLLKSELRDGRRWYELSHDRLIRPIQNFYKKWLSEQPADEQSRLQLFEQSHAYARGRDRRLLLNQGQLLIAKRLLEGESGGEDNNALYALVQASEAEHARVESARARELAEALEQKAAEQQRRVRQLKYGLALVCLLLMLTGGTAIYAYEKGNDAVAQKAVAERLRVEAEARRAEAETQRAEAVKQRGIAVTAAEEERKAKEAAKGLLAKAEAAKEAAVKAEANEARQKQIAQQALGQEQIAKAEALEQERLARAEAQKARGAQLTAESIYVSKQQPSMLPNSVLLAKESMQHSPSVTAYQPLSEGLSLLARPLPALGRRGKVSGVAFSPDGKSALTIGREENEMGTGRGYLWVWDAESGRDLTPEVSLGPVDLIAQSPDRKYLATLDASTETVSVWEWDGRVPHKSAKEVKLEGLVSSFDPFASGVRFAIGPGGKYLAITKVREVSFESPPKSPYYISVWDIANSREVIRLSHDRAVASVVFSPTGETLATGDEQGEVRVFSNFKQDSPLKLLKHPQPVASLAFSHDGQYLALGGVGGLARIVHWSSADTMASVSQEARVNSLAFSDDGRFLAMAGADNTGRVWDVSNSMHHADLAYVFASSPREVGRMAQDGEVSAVAFSHDARYVATASSDGARAWEVPGRTGGIRVHLGETDGYARSYDDQFLATWGSAGIFVWSQHDGSLAYSLPLKNYPAEVDISKDGSLLAVAGHGSIYGGLNTLSVMSRDGGEAKEIKYNVESVESPLFSPGGEYLAVIIQGSKISLFDPKTLREYATLYAGDKVTNKAFSATSKYLAAATRTGVKVWRVPELTPIVDLKDVPAAKSVVFSPKGTYLLTVGLSSPADRTADTRVEVWNFSDGRAIKFDKQLPHFTTLDNQGAINHLALTPDERYVATAGADNDARVWSLPDGKKLATMSHADQVLYVAFGGDKPGEDGKYLVTASNDNTVRVWNVSTGCEIARVGQAGARETNPWLSASDSINYISSSHVGPFAFLNPEGRYLITGSSNEVEMRIWRPKDLEGRACEYVTRNISASEWSSKYYLDGEVPLTCGDLPQDKLVPTASPSTCEARAKGDEQNRPMAPKKQRRKRAAEARGAARTGDKDEE